MSVLGPDGQPIRRGALVDVRPGTGGKVLFRETSYVDIPGGTQIRFAPGAYLIIAEVDWDRMIAKTAIELPKA